MRRKAMVKIMTDILIFSGQSNMQGQTESCPDDAAVAGAWEYRRLTDTAVPLVHPVGEDIGEGLLLAAHEGHGSLIPDFCRAYIEVTGRRVMAVHVARGATMVSEWQAGGERFAAMADKCRGALEAVRRTDEVGRVFFVWLQGESDAIAGLSKTDYMAGMRTFRASLTDALPVACFALIRVGKFVGDARDIAIIEAQESLAADGDFLLLTRLTGVCTNDPARWLNPYAAGHYNNAAMTLIGRAAGKNLGLYALGEDFELEPEPYAEVHA